MDVFLRQVEGLTHSIAAEKLEVESLCELEHGMISYLILIVYADYVFGTGASEDFTREF